MLAKGLGSQKYQQLLKQQEQEDNERKQKLEELRKRTLREDIKRKRDEAEARKKAQLVRERRLEDLKLEKQRKEDAEKKKAQDVEEEKKKRPLSVEEAKARRERAEAARNSQGLAKARQDLKPVIRPISTKYSSLLASAPTKLDKLSPSSPIKRGSPLERRPPPFSASKDRIGPSGKTPANTSAVESKKASPAPLPASARSSDQPSKPKDQAKIKPNLSSSSKIVQPDPIKPRLPPASIPQQKRKARPAYDYDSEDDYRAHTNGQSIWEIMNPGKSRTQYLARDIDSDDEMEANAEDIRREEQRAIKAAKLEDEREARLLQEHEARKNAKRKKGRIE